MNDENTYDTSETIKEWVNTLCLCNKCKDVDSVPLAVIEDEIHEIRYAFYNNRTFMGGENDVETLEYLINSEKEYMDYLELLEDVRDRRLSEPILGAIVLFVKEGYGENICDASYDLESLANAIKVALSQEQ